MGACALILLVLPATAQSQSDADLGAQLTRHLSTMKKDQQVLRFLQSHQWLFSDPRFCGSGEAPAAAPHAEPRPDAEEGGRREARARAAARHRAQVRRLAAVQAATPQNVICRVFGDHCQEALAVSRCESGLRTDAQNGQYLGLFQMGSSERRIFGHGPSGDRAGRRRPPVLRRVGQRLGPVVLQALVGLALLDVSSCKVRNPAARPGSHDARGVVEVSPCDMATAKERSPEAPRRGGRLRTLPRRP